MKDIRQPSPAPRRQFPTSAPPTPLGLNRSTDCVPMKPQRTKNRKGSNLSVTRVPRQLSPTPGRGMGSSSPTLTSVPYSSTPNSGSTPSLVAGIPPRRQLSPVKNRSPRTVRPLQRSTSSSQNICMGVLKREPSTGRIVSPRRLRTTSTKTDSTGNAWIPSPSPSPPTRSPRQYLRDVNSSYGSVDELRLGPPSPVVTSSTTTSTCNSPNQNSSSFIDSSKTSFELLEEIANNISAWRRETMKLEALLQQLNDDAQGKVSTHSGVTYASQFCFAFFLVT